MDSVLERMEPKMVSFMSIHLFHGGQSPLRHLNLKQKDSVFLN